MSKICLLLICFFAVNTLTAEMIGPVEYHLPNQGQGWKVGNELQTDRKTKSTTIIYVPEGTISNQDVKESFAAYVNNLKSDIDDQASLEKSIQVNFPEQKVSLNILEKTPQSILYEWNVSDSGHEKVHGWSRGFSIPEGTVVLMYQTQDIDKVNEVGPSWIQALKEARLVK